MAAAQPAPLAAALPGLALCFAITGLAMALRSATGAAALNPVIVALLLGMTVRATVGIAASWKPGIAFAGRPLLRGAIVLLGLQVTLGELWALGPGALLLAVLVVSVTLPATIWLGRAMGVAAPLALLIGTGTAICGASAIVAANQVARGRDEDVAYALAVITLCGTAGMVILPLLAAAIGLEAHGYGLWAGAALHEVVQAVGAAAAGGAEAAQSGTVMKLARVFLLAPVLLALGWWLARGRAEQGAAGVPVPWFAFGFLALVLMGSTAELPAALKEASRSVVPWLLAASVAALGISTDLAQLRARGGAPLLLGLAATVLIAAISLAGVKLIG